ncbi:flavodoxin family protein [Parvularcula sp. ZS-1/3]|uniref:Flavodoxin family protein n=1 Tax=Parvularcula mediterranea TaxID=2732508 RepID=A0A7Y3W4G8_9PROT|nr:flavodoxin family protein [Parvularcula mediterranea]NNU15504.1 flavodoxin family protein [Parvularcula mediterranea]
MTTIAIIYHSGYGHTKLVAEAVRDGAASVDGVEVRLHTVEEAGDALDSFDDVAGIIFGSPTYMGSVSAPMEDFFDKTSKIWFRQGWKDKLAGGFTNSGSLSGDKLATLQRMSVLAGQQQMLWVNLGLGNQTSDPDYDGAFEDAVNRVGGYLGPMAQSANAEPGPNNPPRGDIKTAKLYGERFAKAAKRWGVGLIE